MQKIKTIILFLLTAAISQAFADDIVANVNRHGRRIQADGFLLEWDRKNASRWDGSVWAWDAVITADGVAGYISSREAPGCSSWTFSITVVDSNRTHRITVPGEAGDDVFAFDKGSFESAGAYNTEWLVPWSAFEGGAYILILDAESGCGDELNSLLLFVNRDKGPGNYAAVIISAAALLAGFAAGVIIRKRKVFKRPPANKRWRTKRGGAA